MAKKQNMLKKESPDNHTTDKVNVISNCLLGQYMGEEYVIAEDIKDELIAVKKIKRSVFQNSVFCSAQFEEYGHIQFEVTFSKNTVKSVAMCELYVLEKDSKINGYIENTIRTKVGQYVDELENFIEKAYAHFNISLTEQNGREYNLDEDISIEAYIGAKRKFNLNMAKLTKKEYNKLYKDYVSKRLELLKKINSPYTQTILEKFNEEYAKIEKYFLSDNNYKSISELLDKCIEDCSGINPAFAAQEKELMEQMKPIVEDFSKQAETIAKQAEPKAMGGLPIEDKNRMEEIERQQAEQTPVPKTPVVEAPVRTTDNTPSASSSGKKQQQTTQTTQTTPNRENGPQNQDVHVNLGKNYTEAGVKIRPKATPSQTRVQTKPQDPEKQIINLNESKYPKNFNEQGPQGPNQQGQPSAFARDAGGDDLNKRGMPDSVNNTPQTNVYRREERDPDINLPG